MLISGEAQIIAGRIENFLKINKRVYLRPKSNQPFLLQHILKTLYSEIKYSKTKYELCWNFLGLEGKYYDSNQFS